MSLPCSTIHEMSYPPTALCTCLFVSNMILIYRSPLALFLLLFHLCFYDAESCSFLCLSSIFPSSSFLVSSHISGFTSPLNSRSFLSVSELLITCILCLCICAIVNTAVDRSVMKKCMKRLAKCCLVKKVKLVMVLIY